MTSTNIKLGRGVLGAPSWERHGDRNRVVRLTPTGQGLGAGALVFGRAPVGKVGELVARVIDDLNKPIPNIRFNLKPQDWKAADGAEVVIGTGELFTEELERDGKPRLIGVRPLDGRQEGWLDTMPVWHSEVELFFVEGGGL